MRSIPFALLATALALPGIPALPGAAQEPAGPLGEADSTVVDGVAAVVGDSVILVSEVQQLVVAAADQGQEVAPEDVLSDLVTQKLIVQAAARDTTLRIPEDELERRVDQAVEVDRDRFPTETAFQQALEQQGLTATTHRERRRQQLRTRLLQDLYMQRAIQTAPPVAVSEAEMRAFYEDERADLQQRPEILTLEEVMVPVRAKAEAWVEARAVADSLYEEIQGGADFQELATEFSEDPGTAPNGGDLGWFRRGHMVRDFELVAFGQHPGTVSTPARTEFGWHLILTERLRPGEVKARHILIRPEITEDDRQTTLDRAEEVARSAENGEDLEEVAASQANLDQPEEFDRYQMSRDQITGDERQGYADNLAGAGEADVLGPFRTLVGNGEYFVVLRVEELREAGEFTFEDLRDQIRNGLSQEKKVDRIIERLRATTYIDIRM